MLKFHTLRLAAFPVGLGLTSVMVSGTLNRVMIVELGLPAALVGLLFAIPLLLAPARLALGYLSDGRPIGGKRREPYIIIGTGIAAVGMSGAALLITGPVSLGVIALGGGLLFAVYGLGFTLASNTFEALLADRFSGASRPRAVTLAKVAMFAGIMFGALTLGRLLEPFDADRLVWVATSVMVAYVMLATFAVLGQEPSRLDIEIVARKVTEAGFWRTVRDEIGRDPAARRFFVLVVISVLGTLAQDVLLEPYGALALGMSVSQTTRLSAVWGTGTLLAMLSAGLWLIRWAGYWPVLRAGLRLNMAVFVGLILAGALEQMALFWGLVFALGLGTGLAMAGLLTAVIEYTTFARAGLLMGVWGTAAELGQAGGMLMSGVVVDLMRALTGQDVLIAYGTVFALESALLGVALRLSFRVRVPAAQDQSAPGVHLDEVYSTQ
ncbi:MAG: BCD family MFS transporter [Chloroflexi bacterium]|nr:BCD family MFS transporter [Chloroflexota bacterium]